ncbi:MAG: serine/threonine-protein kinase [Polyangiales bacterium]
MLPTAITEALRTLTAHAARAPGTPEALVVWWCDRDPKSPLPEDARAAADALDRQLPAATRSVQGAADLGALLHQPEGEAVFAWCVASVSRTDVRIAPILQAAAASVSYRERLASVARARVVEGPLLDALACVPLTGPGSLLLRPEHAQVRARLDILLWEAGASGLQLPELGAWLWASDATFEAVVGQAARGTLRGRVIAARTLEVCAVGLPRSTAPERVGRTLQVLQPLLLHPEPLVWVHAARAVGRFAGVLDMLEGTLLDWLRSESPVLRQRAVTAFASQGTERLKVLAGELTSVIEEAGREPWAITAASAATPYLFTERRDLWDAIAQRVLAGEGGSIAARALARGLAALWRRGVRLPAVEAPLRRLREMARRTHTGSLDEWRRWLDVLASTDPVDGAERDPLDLELGLENLVRLAAQYDDEEADARAARFAGALAVTFQEARRVALSDTSARRRAAGMNAMEGIARSLALGLWGPLLATRPAGTPVDEPDLNETWDVIAKAPESLLDEVAERRAGDDLDPQSTDGLEVLAVRLGGYALDACGEEPDLGPGRGPTAHHTCLWLRKVGGLTDGTRELPQALRTALSALLWRLVDTTRGTVLGEVDDLRWLGPFAAWWALVVDRPAVLQQLASALPMLSKEALDRCCEVADAIRGALAGDPSRASEGLWGDAVASSLAALHAGDTELAAALAATAGSLARFHGTSGTRPDLEARCHDLATAAERLHAALADPVKGLHPPVSAADDNAPRVAAVLAKAIRARDLGPAEVWIDALGPVASALVSAASQGAVRRTPPPPPAPKKKQPQVVEGYELVRPLGQGGVGTVWLVRKPGAERFFVLKIPKADALAEASEKERAGILASFVEEAKALAGLYHPNVANIIDRGVANEIPFLVLEYLIGADLKAYSAARLMSLFELRQVVLETCAGLAALHAAGIVHRDIKPANLWLRLPLQGGETFDPAKHRDPAITTPLATVIIDFGMVRAARVTPDAVGRFVAGTPGYMAPEQVLDPLELDQRADVYALAGTVYNVMTGRSFFDDTHSTRERILAHMQRDPLEDPERLRPFPAAVAKLLRAATAHAAKDRPTPLEFGREFAKLF